MPSNIAMVKKEKDLEKQEIQLESAHLHDSVALIANSKTLGQNTIPGGKLIWETETATIRIERPGKKTAWIPIPNVKAMFSK